MDERAGQQLLLKSVDECLYQLAATDDPVGQRGAADVDVEAFESCFLAVQRQSINKLGGGDEGQRAGSRQALGDRLWR